MNINIIHSDMFQYNVGNLVHTNYKHFQEKCTLQNMEQFSNQTDS